MPRHAACETNGASAPTQDSSRLPPLAEASSESRGEIYEEVVVVVVAVVVVALLLPVSSCHPHHDLLSCASLPLGR